MNGGVRAAFLGTGYGTAVGRARLSEQPGPAPTWAAGSWAIVTAWNPGGERVSGAVNVQAQAELLALVRASGFALTPAVNGEGDWTEAALLVHGARLRRAAEWGLQFRQAAVLWGVGARAALVWLDSGRVTAVERRWVVEHG
ncbi:DUF3293 domain-containing protein [Deinococcus sp. MIMF12]|uniref:DUF3293 domain-containing protein n=1 Tax=Deinococcus rhizophilus TaxID=3049544 RepID=A0ABT7JI49_9DEIO|nr:DUF3293 domain-containing protein [Deinococcus rhizophilus]MDL2344118.1 DUF3293 domain-containing protein [Deinococcus rhizophilus]